MNRVTKIFSCMKNQLFTIIISGSLKESAEKHWHWLTSIFVKVKVEEADSIEWRWASTISFQQQSAQPLAPQGGDLHPPPFSSLLHCPSLSLAAANSFHFHSKDLFRDEPEEHQSSGKVLKIWLWCCQYSDLNTWIYILLIWISFLTFFF